MRWTHAAFQFAAKAQTWFACFQIRGNILDYAPTLILIGGSAGGIEATLEIVSALPASTQAAVVVAIHSNQAQGLAGIITKRAKIPAFMIRNRGKVSGGVIHVCPGGAQTWIQDGFFVVAPGRAGRRFTPSIDLLFESAAVGYRERAVAAIVSGMLNDGKLGAYALRRFGARMFIQNPEEALYRSMPDATISTGHPEEIMSAAMIGEKLAQSLSLPA